MPQVITPSVLDAIFQGYNFVFNDALKGVTPTWSKVAMQVPSTAAVENYGWLGQMPRMREWVGDRVLASLDAFGYQIKNKTFESGFAVKREQIEDDAYGLFRPAAAELGRSVALFPDELVYGLLKAGFASNCYDGQYFFDVDHPVKDEKGVEYSVSNMQAGAGPAWFLMDISRALKPLIYQTRRAFEFVAKTDPQKSDRVWEKNEFAYGVDGRCNAGFGLWQLAYGSKAALNRANLRAARQAMISLKADYGRPLGINPTLLVVGPSLEQTARDLIKSKFLPVDGAPGEPVLMGAVGMIDNTDMDLFDIHMSPWLD